MNVAQLIKMLSGLPPKAEVLGTVFDDQNEIYLDEPVVGLDVGEMFKMPDGTWEPPEEEDRWGNPRIGGKRRKVVFLVLGQLHYETERKAEKDDARAKKAARLAAAESSTILEDTFPDRI